MSSHLHPLCEIAAPPVLVLDDDARDRATVHDDVGKNGVVEDVCPALLRHLFEHQLHALDLEIGVPRGADTEAGLGRAPTNLVGDPAHDDHVVFAHNLDVIRSGDSFHALLLVVRSSSTCVMLSRSSIQAH